MSRVTDEVERIREEIKESLKRLSFNEHYEFLRLVQDECAVACEDED